MNPLNLDNCKPLFRDEGAYAEFLKILKQGLSDFSPVISNEEVLGTFLSQEATKEILYERIVRRMANSPGILEEITDRLTNDPIVDGSDILH